jgi:hypothetical protein
MGNATSTAAPERARRPRLAAAPHRQLRSLLPRGYAGFTEATVPRHLVLPATASVPLAVKIADSPHRPPAFLMGARGSSTVVESGRSGPFWDGVDGRAPIPPAAATLGFQFVDADVEAGTIEVAFAATGAFTNPAGDVVFLEASLLDAGGAVIATAAATAQVISLNRAADAA